MNEELNNNSEFEQEGIAHKTPPVPKERYDLRILGSLRRIIRAIDIYSRKLASDHGVTVPQLMCMMKIDELGAMTIKKLSEEIYLNPSTIVGIVDRLEKNQILTRERSVRDRRKVRIHLTEKGKTMLASSPPPLEQGLSEAIEALPELEKLTIASSLDKIISLIDKSTPNEIEMHTIPQEPVLETVSNLHEVDDSVS
ncbi:MAG: MarR family transcriptional regulator [Opitutales bacterium]|nr:MarR family transcriptional regulator [Opitutales bacterium]